MKRDCSAIEASELIKAIKSMEGLQQEAIDRSLEMFMENVDKVRFFTAMDFSARARFLSRNVLKDNC